MVLFRSIDWYCALTKMPGPWYPFNSNEGGDEQMRGTFRKRRAIDSDDFEIPREHSVSPKRHRSMRNTMSPGRKYGFGNESMAAFGFSQLPFPPQTGPTTAGSSVDSPITFFGRYENVGSPVSEMAMDTDEGYVSERSILAAPPIRKTPEKDMSYSICSDSPELYRQFYMNGYSPRLIERVIEEKRISAGTLIDGRAYPMPSENPSNQSNGSAVFACSMFPRHSDIY